MARSDENLVGRGRVARGDAVILTDVIYKISLMAGGAVLGEIKAPYHARLTDLIAAGPADWLRLHLDDERTVFFQIKRADASPGGWGDIEGRLAP